MSGGAGLAVAPQRPRQRRRPASGNAPRQRRQPAQAFYQHVCLINEGVYCGGGRRAADLPRSGDVSSAGAAAQSRDVTGVQRQDCDATQPNFGGSCGFVELWAVWP